VSGKSTDHTKHSQTPKPDTPGRPKDSGSRQQTHHEQGGQTGSPELDREITRGGGSKHGGAPLPKK
jgi:hypothetical protein